jgi:leucyl/phenylalanyl-tRNA--protein transferase
MPRDSAHDIDPDDLLKAYALGYFPMARRRTDASVVWVLPDERGVLDLDKGAHVPRKLRRLIARAPFDVKIDAAFPAVLRACAEPGPGREDTWINDPIAEVYAELHRLGRAHSVECYEAGALVGGLYGVALGQVFCGESMFSRRDNASKIAFAWLIAILKRGGFKLLDTQFHTEHLAQFGVEKMPCADYLRRLDRLARAKAQFSADYLDAAAVLQSMTQTS